MTKLRLLSLSLILLSSSLSPFFADPGETGGEPDLDGLNVETAVPVRGAVAASAALENHPNYAAEVAKLTKDFQTVAIPSNEAQASRVFEEFIKNPQNSGLMVGFLKGYDKKSLQTFKEQFFSAYITEFFKKIGTTAAKLEEYKTKKAQEQVRKIERSLAEIQRKADALRKSLEAQGKSPAEVMSAVDALTLGDRATAQARKKYWRISLEEIGSEQSSFLPSFITGENSSYRDGMAFLVEIMGKIAQHRDLPVEKNIATDLISRVTFIGKLADKAKRSDDGRKYSVAYVLSWFMTKENFDQAMLESVAATTPTSPVATGPQAGEPVTTSPASTVVGGIPQVTELSAEQATQMNLMIRQVKQVSEYQFFGPMPRKKGSAWLYSNIITPGIAAAKNIFVTSGLPELEAKLASAAAARPESAAYFKAKADKVKQYIAESDEAGKRRDATVARINAILANHNITIGSENLKKLTQVGDILKVLAKAGVKGDDAQMRELMSHVNEYATLTYKWAELVTRAVLERDALVLEMNEAIQDQNSSGSKRLREIIAWIKQFNENRPGLISAGKVDKNAAKTYTEVNQNMLAFVAKESPTQMPLFNAAFQTNPGWPEEAVGCAAMFKGLDMNKMLVAKGNDPQTLVSNLASDAVVSYPEKRLVCLANYQYNLKLLTKSGKSISPIFTVGEDSFGFRADGVIKSMGTEKASVADPKMAQFSLYEGLYDLMGFMKGLRLWIVQYLTRELKREGVTVSQVGEGVRVESRSMTNIGLRISDSILFDFNKFEVKPAGKAQLEKIAPALAKVLGDEVIFELIKEIVIEGHASPEGTASYNLSLSEKRAKAVDAIIKAQGKLNRFIVKNVGHGEKYPVDKDGNVVAHNPALVPDRVPATVDKEKSRRVVFVFNLNMQAIEDICKEKGDRFFRLKEKISGLVASQPANPVESAPAAPTTPSTSGTVPATAVPSVPVTSSSEVTVPATSVAAQPSTSASVPASAPVSAPAVTPDTKPEAQSAYEERERLRLTREFTGHKKTYNDSMAYLKELKFPEMTNKVYRIDRNAFSANTVQLQPDTAKTVLELYDNLRASNQTAKANYVWAVAGKYFGNDKVRRASAPVEYEVTSVSWYGGRSYKNPIERDLTQIFDMVNKPDIKPVPAPAKTAQHLAALNKEFANLRTIFNQKLGYLNTEKWGNRPNRVYRVIPNLFAANGVDLMPETSKLILDLYDLLKFNGEGPKADLLWRIMGGFFSDPIQRKPQAKPFEVKEVHWYGTTYQNEIQRDLTSTYRLLEGIEFK